MSEPNIQHRCDHLMEAMTRMLAQCNNGEMNDMVMAVLFSCLNRTIFQ